MTDTIADLRLALAQLQATATRQGWPYAEATYRTNSDARQAHEEAALSALILTVGKDRYDYTMNQTLYVWIFDGEVPRTYLAGSTPCATSIGEALTVMEAQLLQTPSPVGRSVRDARSAIIAATLTLAKSGVDFQEVADIVASHYPDPALQELIDQPF